MSSQEGCRHITNYRPDIMPGYPCENTKKYHPVGYSNPRPARFSGGGNWGPVQWMYYPAYTGIYYEQNEYGNIVRNPQNPTYPYPMDVAPRCTPSQNAPPPLPPARMLGV